MVLQFGFLKNLGRVTDVSFVGEKGKNKVFPLTYALLSLYIKKDFMLMELHKSNDYLRSKQV